MVAFRTSLLTCLLIVGVAVFAAPASAQGLLERTCDYGGGTCKPTNECTGDVDYYCDDPRGFEGCDVYSEGIQIRNYNLGWGCYYLCVLDPICDLF